MQFNKKNKFDKFRLEKFYKAQRAYFGLNKYGTTPAGLSRSTKSFIYNKYCLPIGLYFFLILDYIHKNESKEFY
jgi:hypothetical protein